jgi:hypothetical protein
MNLKGGLGQMTIGFECGLRKGLQGWQYGDSTSLSKGVQCFRKTVL